MAAAFAKHPDIRSAAFALLNGWGNPLGFLALDDEKYDIAVAIVNVAEQIRREKGGY